MVWIICWGLFIEYAIGNVAVAVSWSGYFQELLRGFDLALPEWMATDYITAFRDSRILEQALAAGTDTATLPAHVLQAASAVENAPHLFGFPIILNLPAVAIVAAITWILVRGIRESAWMNAGMVVLKLGILAFFVIAGAFYVRPENWTPFAPNGFHGVWTGAALIFFAYIGFDAVSTAAEESKNPQKDMPFAMMMSLGVTSIIYIIVRSEEHTSELQSPCNLVCRLLLEKKNKILPKERRQVNVLYMRQARSWYESSAADYEGANGSPNKRQAGGRVWDVRAHASAARVRS